MCRSAWSIFLNLVGDIGFNEIRMFHADRFKVARLKTVSPVTVNLQLRTLRPKQRILQDQGREDESTAIK